MPPARPREPRRCLFSPSPRAPLSPQRRLQRDADRQLARNAQRADAPQRAGSQIHAEPVREQHGTARTRQQHTPSMFFFPPFSHFAYVTRHTQQLPRVRRRAAPLQPVQVMPEP